MESIIAIASQFATGKVTNVEALGNGNINRTYLVTVPEAKPFVLQQLNSNVFPEPLKIIENLQVITSYAHQKIGDLGCRWKMPELLPTKQQYYYADEDNNFWRAISFIEGAESIEEIANTQQAVEIGRGLGIFHLLVRDINPDLLADTLPGFHITPNYYQQYQETLEKAKIPEITQSKYCQRFISAREAIVNDLEQAKAAKILPIRIMHGDPKVNNLLLDKQTKKAIAIIDLDTVKPGLVHYDIGDCLRSGCNRLGEETRYWQQVEFDLELAAAILEGYLGVTNNFISDMERTYIYEAVRLISFELGLRFFTDYLNGNTYFKTIYPEQNLNRALVQFQLTKSIEDQEREIRKLLD